MDFPATNWTILASATLNGDEAGRKAMNELCSKYWEPVAQVIQARGAPSERVDDLTQDFFLQILDRRFFQRAERGKGKFRSFMLASLRHFLADDAKSQARQKRGGHLQKISLEDEEVTMEREELQFDRNWAQMIFRQTLKKTKEAVSKNRSEEQWNFLSAFLPGSNRGAVPYEELSQVLNLSEGGAKKEIYRLRATFREALREQVGLTVSAPHEIDEELAHLRATFEKYSDLLGQAES
jgi:RNA polymerase sigma-70 factor (ECF subfamily)